MSTTRHTRRRSQIPHRVAQSIALDLRLEGISPDDVSVILEVSQRQAVAILDGHPSAASIGQLYVLAGVAGVDFVGVFGAAEAQDEQGQR